MGLSLVLLPPVVGVLGAIALLVFAHGTWEANTETCSNRDPPIALATPLSRWSSPFAGDLVDGCEEG